MGFKKNGAQSPVSICCQFNKPCELRGARGELLQVNLNRHVIDIR